MKRASLSGLAALMSCAFPWSILATEPPAATEKPTQTTPSEGETKWVRAVEPKALSQNVQRGLAWMIATQLENGGWSQGVESIRMGQGMDPLKAKPNVADTCISSLALMRAGSTPRSDHMRVFRRYQRSWHLIRRPADSVVAR